MPEEKESKVAAQRRMKQERLKTPAQTPYTAPDTPELSPTAYQEVRARALALGCWSIVHQLLKVSRG